MFHSVPIQFWLLMLIAISAYPPGAYVFRYVSHSPSRREMAQRMEDVSWHSSKRLAFNLVLLALLALGGVFIFTPAATEFARSPNFWPILMAGLAAFSFYETIQGFLKAEASPLVRGRLGPYSRLHQPRRYWASMIWNLAFSILLVFLVFKIWTGAQ